MDKYGKRKQKEFWVGVLVCVAAALVIVFGWLMGVIGPFHQEVKFHVLYAFAGGIEVGSPVRVSGVKVGKVDRIDFLPAPGSDRANINLTIDVSKVAVEAVRNDSKFYVNMAGIIGERYIEISPGSESAPLLPAGSTVRGVDPPRIDQLLSQGYGVFGQIQDFLDENRETITGFLGELNHFMKDANKLLTREDKDRFVDLVDNLNSTLEDVQDVTQRLKAQRTQQFLDEMADIVHRAHSIDKPALHKFLQEEGIRAHIF